MSFNKSLPFILGLIFVVKLVDNTYVGILITRLNGVWGKNESDLRRNVSVVNLLEGATGILASLFAYVANVYTGRFVIVVFSAVACIVGLILDYVAANDGEGQYNLDLFYLALALMALAGAAQKGSLEAFLFDQFREGLGEGQIPPSQPIDEGQIPPSQPIDEGQIPTSQHIDEGQIPPSQPIDESRRPEYSNFWWTTPSFVAAIFAQFWYLPRFYFSKLALVLVAAMVFFFLLFLLGAKFGMKIKKVRTAETVLRESRFEGTKLFVLWVFLLTLNLVYACGNTFFVVEANELANSKKLFSIIIFSNVVRFSSFIASKISSYVVRRYRNQRKMELLRIGIGMSSCVMCCIISGVTATHRRYNKGNMTVYWLIPQHILLGLMFGLANGGFQALYESRIFEKRSIYGQAFREVARGVGSFVSLFLVRMKPLGIFREQLNDSSLNDYYALLAGLSLLNFTIYSAVAFSYILGDEDEDISAHREGELLESTSGHHTSITISPEIQLPEIPVPSASTPALPRQRHVPKTGESDTSEEGAKGRGNEDVFEDKHDHAE